MAQGKIHAAQLVALSGGTGNTLYVVDMHGELWRGVDNGSAHENGDGLVMWKRIQLPDDPYITPETR